MITVFVLQNQLSSEQELRSHLTNALHAHASAVDAAKNVLRQHAVGAECSSWAAITAAESAARSVEQLETRLEHMNIENRMRREDGSDLRDQLRRQSRMFAERELQLQVRARATTAG